MPLVKRISFHVFIVPGIFTPDQSLGRWKCVSAFPYRLRVRYGVDDQRVPLRIHVNRFIVSVSTSITINVRASRVSQDRPLQDDVVEVNPNLDRSAV